MSTIIKSVRFIRSQEILRLDQMSLSSGNTGTNHDHSNKVFLDNLNIDSENRLTHGNEILPIPVVEDTW